MKAGGLFGRVFSRVIPGSEQFSFPSSLEDPSAVLVVVGPDPGDIWAGLVLLNNLARHYPSSEIVAVAPEEDMELVNLLARVPSASGYHSGRSGSPDFPGIDRDRSVAFCVSAGRAASKLLEATGAPVRASVHPLDGANLRVRLSPRPLPDAVHGMCDALRITSDRSWRPVPLAADSARASSLLAPVSGRSLPYIAADAGVLGMMRRAGAELPLRVVTVSGRDCALAAESRAVRAAVTAGASAVLADSRSLWVEACALGIPAVGLDRRGTFPDWGREPARSATDLSAQWAALLRQGW